MIFDLNYDKSLWLLVAGCKKDSENICKLINYIPEEIFKKIQKSIYDYYMGNLGIVNENVIYSDIFNDKDGYGCSIMVKIVLGKLYLTLYRWIEDKDRIEEEYHLMLKDINNNIIDDMLLFDKILIGKYSSEVNNIKFLKSLTDVETSNYDRKFIIKRVLFGYVVSSYLKKIKVGSRYVNVNRNMPNEIFYDDFSSQEKIKSLVRKKK